MPETVESVYVLPQEGGSPDVTFGGGEATGTTEQVPTDEYCAQHRRLMPVPALHNR